MVKVSPFRRALLVTALLSAAAPAFAAGGGYAGLIAPAPDDAAPAVKSAAPAQAPAQTYSGVMAAPIEEAPEQAAIPNTQFTPAPSMQPSKNLSIISMIHGSDPNNTGIPKGMKLLNTDFSHIKHNYIGNKSATQYAIDNNIAQAMAGINDTSLPDSQRALNAKSAYKSLGRLADGLRYKQTIPDTVYQQMGLTTSYINEEHTGNQAALTSLDAALAALKPYQ